MLELDPCVLLDSPPGGFSRLLEVTGASGTIDWMSAALGALLELAVAPGWAIALPPGRMLPEKAARRASWSVRNFEMFTEEIENRTMNRAISRVIMSE
jgi:hypothetical protein